MNSNAAFLSDGRDAVFYGINSGGEVYENRYFK